MTSTPLVRRQRPLTPPMSSDDDHSFRPLAQYNTSMSSYPAYPTPPQHSGYGDPSYYQTAQPGYHPVSEQHGHYRQPHEGVYARRGKVLGSPIGFGRMHTSERESKSPKPKKARKTNTKPKTTVIHGPLSEVTKDYNVPIKNMEEWVNRSAEVRRKEAEKKGGYVARPMNSFMLYRSAYAERIKMYCKENNHQVVSQVSGASWPQEPKPVRDHYEQLAMLERENHQKAHPEYKFAPNKNAAANKKRKSWESDDESDAEDPEWRSGRSGSSKKARSDRNSARSTPFDTKHPAHPMSLHQSSWEGNSLGRPVPHMIPSADMHGSYYQHHVSQYVPNIDDATMRKTAMGSAGPRVGTPLLGMPGGTHHDLLQPHSQMSTPVPMEAPMDPALMYDGQPHYVPVEDYATTHYQYGPTSGASGVDHHQYTSAPGYHPGMQTLTDHRGGWPGAMGAGSDFDTELNYL